MRSRPGRASPVSSPTPAQASTLGVGVTYGISAYFAWHCCNDPLSPGLGNRLKCRASHSEHILRTIRSAPCHP
jgi:hypothetical protein